MSVAKALIALTLTASAGVAGADDEALVKYRKNTMEIIGGHMGAMVAIVKGEVPYSDDLAFHAQGLAAVAPRALVTFETQAMNDDSHALDKIWADWGKFEQAMENLEQTSATLATAVADGNRGAIGAALGEVGESCKGCHDDFTKDH